jgi:hypothetical protein
MAGEPVGRIGTALRICGRAMRSRYTGHEAPSVWSMAVTQRTLQAATPPRRGFPRSAMRTCLHSFDTTTWTVTLGRVNKDRPRITHIPKVSASGELSQENIKKSGPQVFGVRRHHPCQRSVA